MLDYFKLTGFLIAWVEFYAVNSLNSFSQSLPTIQTGRWACSDNCSTLLTSNQWNYFNITFVQTFDQIPMQGVILVQVDQFDVYYYGIHVQTNAQVLDLNTLSIQIRSNGTFRSLNLTWIATSNNKIFISKISDYGNQIMSFPTSLIPSNNSKLQLFTFVSGIFSFSGAILTSTLLINSSQVQITSSNTEQVNVTVILVNTEISIDNLTQIQTISQQGNGVNGKFNVSTFQVQTGIPQNILIGASSDYHDIGYGELIFYISQSSSGSTWISYSVQHYGQITFQFLQIESFGCTGNSSFTNQSCYCNNGYYDNQQNSCLGCTGISTNCTSCTPNSFRIFNSSAQSCPCQSTYYDNSGTCVKDCSAPCATCTSKSNCSTCVIGFQYDGNSCKNNCTVQNPTAQFVDTLDQIIIALNFSVELTLSPNRGIQSSQQNCIEIFDATTLNLLGQGPYCQINSENIIVILGLLPSVSNLNTIQINPNVINVIGCNASSNQTINVTLPRNIAIPTFNVDYTPTVKKCLPNRIALVNISSTGNRLLKSVQYSVQSITPNNQQTLNVLNALLQAANTAATPQLQLLILEGTLDENSVYQFSVTITNFLSITSTVQMFSFKTLSSTNPYIQLIKGGPYRVSDLIILQAQLSITSCGISVTPGNQIISIQWIVDGVNQTIQQTNSSFLEIVQFTFQPFTFIVGQSVNVQVFASTSTGQAMDTNNIYMTPSPLIGNILGGSKVQGRPQALVLQAVMLDPDVVDQTSLKDANIIWSCQNTLDGTSCDIKNDNQQQLSFNNSLTQTIPPYRLIAQQSYVFFITISKTNGVITKTVTASVTIKVDSISQSSLSILYPARLSTQNANINEILICIVQKIIISNRIRRILVNSQSDSSDTHLTVSINYNGQQVASFYPSTYVIPIILDQYLSGLYVRGQQSVQLQFKYNDPHQQSTTLVSTAIWNFNLPPQPGQLIVSQNVGQALSSNFLIQMVQWIDLSLPLSYKFGYYTSQQLYASDKANNQYTNMVILNDWSNNNFIQTILPQGAFNITTLNYDIFILGFVQNSYGGQSIAQGTLNVKPYINQTFQSKNLQYLDDTLTFISSFVDMASKSQSIDSTTIQMIIQSTQNIAQLQTGGCEQQCFHNGFCDVKTNLCQCNNGFYLDNCLANETQNNQISSVSSNMLNLILSIKSKAHLQYSTQDQLQRSQNILLQNKNVIKNQNSNQISSSIDDIRQGLQKNYNNYGSSGGSSNKTVNDLIYQVPNVAQNKLLDSITSSVGSATTVNDNLFAATAGNNQNAFNNSVYQDSLNKNLMAMSSNTPDFYANSQFTDQPAAIYVGTNMGIIAQKLSKEASLRYFPYIHFLYHGDLTEEELASLAQSTMSGQGDVQMSIVSYNTNPYNSDPNFPYQNQTNQMIGLNFKDQSGQTVYPQKPLTYQLNSNTTNQSLNTCVSENAGKWVKEGCAAQTYAQKTLTDQSQTTCSCITNSKITVVEDIEDLFTGSKIGALENPSALLTFQFWRSSIFYLALAITILWVCFSIWSVKKDILQRAIKDKEREKKDPIEKEKSDREKKLSESVRLNDFSQDVSIRMFIQNQSKDDMSYISPTNQQEQGAIKRNEQPLKQTINKSQNAINIDLHPSMKTIKKNHEDQKIYKKPTILPVVVDKLKDDISLADLDSDEEKHVGSPQKQKERNIVKQFIYCAPILHELLSIFNLYRDQEPRPVRFTIYYLKMIIMMALTSIFGQTLNQTQTIALSIISLAIISPIVIIMQKGFAPSSGKVFKIIASFIVLLVFVGLKNIFIISCWYVSLDIAANQGLEKSNVWTVSYSESLLINIIVIQTVAIVFMIILIPYLSFNLNSGEYHFFFNGQLYDTYSLYCFV